MPVVVSTGLTDGEGVLLAEGAAGISTDGVVDVAWSDAAGFATNEVIVRVESRFGLDVYQPQGVVLIDLDAGS